jgi:hypothetical protein
LGCRGVGERGEYAEGRVPALGVVEDLDPLEDCLR